MLEHYQNIYVSSPSGDDIAILGALPSADFRSRAREVFDAKPVARRFDDGMVAAVPAVDGGWFVFVLSFVPKLTDLPQIIAKAQALSAGIQHYAKALPSPDPQLPRGFIAGLAQRLPRFSRRRKAALAGLLGETLVLQGAATLSVIVECNKNRVIRQWPSDDRIIPVKDSIRNILNDRLRDGSGSMAASKAETLPLELRLVLDRLGAGSASIMLPPSGQPGYGVILFDPVPEQPLVSEVVGLMALGAPHKPVAKRNIWVFRTQMAALAALLLWLAWPVPMSITMSGIAMPAHSTVVALPTDATLAQMNVRVGDMVKAGQLVARFTSAQLEEDRASETLSVQVEALNAQAAMAKNDVGAFKISDQRRQIAELRLQQIQARIDALTINTPVAGRVVVALPDTTTGGFLPLGTEVAQIQTDENFLFRLSPQRVDARLVRIGMTGTAYFKGLTDRDFKVTVTTPPTVVTNNQTGSDEIMLVARIDNNGTEQGDLIAGLAGYAQLDGETAPRIVGLTRYMREYIRVKLWIYLGLAL